MAKSLGLSENPTWMLTKPGTLWLEHTIYTIHYDGRGLFLCYADGKAFGGSSSLDGAKHGCYEHMEQLFTMGLDPFTETAP